MSENFESVLRLTKDLKTAAITLSDDEARYLVDAYYMIQDNRIRSKAQIREQEKTGEPHQTLAWLFTQNETLENQIKRALDSYSDAHPIGKWMKSQYGIGPVIASGMMAHIDIGKAPTAGHIWRYAGYDPTVKWEKKTKRPWNAAFKTLCWKLGQSFLKFSGRDECFYGHLYLKRKDYEIKRNDSGQNAELACETLKAKNFGKSTEAYKHYKAGKLPPAQIDARARRYAVKIFLSHLQQVWWFIETGERAPMPFPIAHQGHVHMIQPIGELPDGF